MVGDVSKMSSKSKQFSVIGLFLICLFHGATTFALTYNFESSEATVLDGLTVGTFVVSGVPLEVQAGLLDATGNFTLGGADASLSVVSPGSIPSFPLAGGLGINSTLFSGTDLSQALEGINQEGLLFNFDPIFEPQILTFRVFGNVTGFHVFSNLEDGAVSSVFGLESDGVFILNPGITTLSLNIAGGTDPAVFVTSIKGTVIPEPSTMLLFGTGLASLAAWRYRKSVKQ